MFSRHLSSVLDGGKGHGAKGDNSCPPLLPVLSWLLSLKDGPCGGPRRGGGRTRNGPQDVWTRSSHPGLSSPCTFSLTAGAVQAVSRAGSSRPLSGGPLRRNQSDASARVPRNGLPPPHAVQGCAHGALREVCTSAFSDGFSKPLPPTLLPVPASEPSREIVTSFSS